MSTGRTAVSASPLVQRGGDTLKERIMGQDIGDVGAKIGDLVNAIGEVMRGGNLGADMTNMGALVVQLAQLTSLMSTLVAAFQRDFERFGRVISVRGNELTLKVGSAAITLKADGTIAITGTQITINGLDVSIKGAKQTTLASEEQLDVNGRSLRVQAARTFSINSGGDATVHSGGTLTVRGDYELYLRSKGRSMTVP
jgi:hypothetical protein